MKVLFVRFSSLGDVILTTGIMKKFSELQPGAEIHFLTSTEYEDIFKNEKHIQKVLAFDRKSGFSSYIKFIQDNINGYDYIIDLHGSLRSRFLKISTDANYFVYRKDSFRRRFFVKKRLFKDSLNKTVTEKYWETLEKAFGFEKLNPDDLKPTLNFETKDENYVVVHSQASKYTKTWPYMVELTEKLVVQGLKVIFVGAGRQELTENIVNMTGKTDLLKLIDIIAKSSGVITTDSGPMHLSIALNKKTLIIAGCTVREFGFLYEYDNVKIIETEGLECRPCHVHGLEKCPKSHFKCMKDIDVKRVEKEFLDLLN